MSNLFGSNSTKTEPATFDIPAFQSSGGITPQQQALGQYSYGQDLLAQSSLYGGSGTGDSTMATQGAEGARNTAELQTAEMSDTNQGAIYDLYKNDISGIEQGLGNAASLNIAPGSTPSTSLGDLASFASFGNQPAAFGIDPNASLK